MFCGSSWIDLPAIVVQTGRVRPRPGLAALLGGAEPADHLAGRGRPGLRLQGALAGRAVAQGPAVRVPGARCGRARPLRREAEPSVRHAESDRPPPRGVRLAAGRPGSCSSATSNDKYLPTIHSIRLVLRAGVHLPRRYVLLYTLVAVAANLLQTLVQLLLGGHTVAFWFLLRAVPRLVLRTCRSRRCGSACWRWRSAAAWSSSGPSSRRRPRPRNRSGRRTGARDASADGADERWPAGPGPRCWPYCWPCCRWR